jgi:hypothetical protein
VAILDTGQHRVPGPESHLARGPVNITSTWTFSRCWKIVKRWSAYDASMSSIHGGWRNTSTLNMDPKSGACGSPLWRSQRSVLRSCDWSSFHYMSVESTYLRWIPPPLHGLRLQNGFGCSSCLVVQQDEAAISNHYTQSHLFTRKKGEKLWTRMVFQQFTRSGVNKTMFRVRSPATEHLNNKRQDLTRAYHIRSSYQAQIMKQLDQEEAALVAQSTKYLGIIQQTKVSPWLEATR